MTTPKAIETETQFKDVTDAKALEELFALSHSQPVVLFKHSVTCPISTAAYQQMSRCGGSVSLIIVQSARDISRRIETKTGVRHESPQAIILRNGQAAWSASHWNVTTDAVKNALSQQQ
ncbi:MAG: bacillithiol system redox-active protein YtxJ [Pyrinomonadaceae bacterium]|nr:bacillithiol system redox-active protein YtxJ [Pyrinomonadaceae bacterium]